VYRSREKVTWEWRKLRIDELRDLYPSPNITVILSRIILAGHVACMGRGRGVHKVLLGKPEGKN
jgi:hypothetical protein